MNTFATSLRTDTRLTLRSLGDDRVAAQKKEEAMDIDVGRAAERQRAARLLSGRRRRRRHGGQ